VAGIRKRSRVEFDCFVLVEKSYFRHIFKTNEKEETWY
jgi:hypothetical protein